MTLFNPKGITLKEAQQAAERCASSPEQSGSDLRRLAENAWNTLPLRKYGEVRILVEALGVDTQNTEINGSVR